MNKTKNIELIFTQVFIILIPLFLIQGHICKYREPEFCKNYLFKNFWEENGFIENFQSLLLLFAILFLFKSYLKIENYNFIKFFFLLKIIALVYFLGEEISWGQHFFKWNSPTLFLEYNNQEETNLHNISNLFDQLPRTLVILWCVFSPLIFLLLKKLMNLNLYIIRPTFVLSYISILLFILISPDFFIDKLNLHPGHVDQFGKEIYESKFYDLITFNFIRLSELHELIFAFYFFIYSYSSSKTALVTWKIN
ncbi:hypothetical protein OAM09_01250 [Candidatus Pelagibacter sp.]|nr:hypothetical protein [Candidatus Pelagibacter sp.]